MVAERYGSVMNNFQASRQLEERIEALLKEFRGQYILWSSGAAPSRDPAADPPADDLVLRAGSSEEDLRTLRRHERTGRPLGSETFVRRLQRTLRRLLCPQKPAPKAKSSMR